MFKKQLFGYSKKETNALLMQIDADFDKSKDEFTLQIEALEDECNTLKASINDELTTVNHYRKRLNIIRKAFEQRVK